MKSGVYCERNGRMKITIEVSDHPWRCIDDNGKRCGWLSTSGFGQRWGCWLFSEQAKYGLVQLEERNGCLVKHEKCLEKVRESADGQNGSKGNLPG
jgi:hypothetical protein